MPKRKKQIKQETEQVEELNSSPASESNDNDSVEAVDSLSEVEILRNELEQTQTIIEELKNKHLRALAETQTVRHRLQQDVNRAKEQGADKVILSVLPVYDDLNRALETAAADPNSITEGVSKVLDNLKRNLESLGIKESGKVGDVFDPELHEALSTMPTDDKEKIGTIAKVYESGFVKDGRVVRVARVIVYQN